MNSPHFLAPVLSDLRSRWDAVTTRRILARLPEDVQRDIGVDSNGRPTCPTARSK